MTLSEDIASVSDAKFIDANTGATLSGGAVSVSVDPTNAKVVNVNYTIDYSWLGEGSTPGQSHTIKLQFTAIDKSNNTALITSNAYQVN